MKIPTLMIALISCGCALSPADEGDAEQAQAALTTRATCQPLEVSRGAIGAGQTAATLATRDLSGTADTWDRYIEFAPGTQAVCNFAVTGAGTVTALSLRVNYRGPVKGDMVWTFQAWDARAGAWVSVGDNGFAADWRWSAADLALPAPLDRFVSQGRVRVRYGTTATSDASQLDEWTLQATTNGTTPPNPNPNPNPNPDPGGIWRPRPGTSWQWQITESVDTSFDVTMYDVDLFDTPQATIDALRARGRVVICYFSAGSWEDWRSDAGAFPRAALGNELDDWEGERWLDTRNAGVRTVMRSRLDLAVRKRCHGVEPDNVDGMSNDPGFPLTNATQLDYNRFLAAEAHARGLSIGLKNDLGQVDELVDHFDWALNESCMRYDECEELLPFIRAGKAVFHVEYGAASLARSVCPHTRSLGFSTLIKNQHLDAWRVACD